MSDLFGNHIVGFPTRRLNYIITPREYLFMRFSETTWAQSGHILYCCSPLRAADDFLGQCVKIGVAALDRSRATHD